eukprot:gene14734-19803_t
MAKLIVFVCVSNTCRSPMAEHLFRNTLQNHGINADQVTVISRSLTEDYEPENSPASSQGVEVLREDYNLDLTSHRSKLLCEQDVNESLMIIPVKRELGRYISQLYPQSSIKLHFLSQDIQDPWHQPIDVYRKCAKQIDNLQQQEILPLLLN